MPKLNHYKASDNVQRRAVFYPVSQKPITKNSQVDLTYCQSATLTNAGDKTLMLFGGDVTLRPGGSIIAGHSGSYDLIRSKINVTFDPTDANPRLEVIEWHYDTNNSLNC